MENYKLKRYIIIFESICKKFGKNNYKSWWIWNWKTKFHQYKTPISIKKIDINKIVVSYKVSFGKKGFKYFISCKDPKKDKPLCIFPSKITAYRKDFYEVKHISFFIKNDELLKKI